MGAVKDKDGKTRHWKEFTGVGKGGGPEYEEYETDILDKHGKPTGKKKKEKKPKWSESITEEDKKPGKEKEEGKSPGEYQEKGEYIAKYDTEGVYELFSEEQVDQKKLIEVLKLISEFSSEKVLETIQEQLERQAQIDIAALEIIILLSIGNKLTKLSKKKNPMKLLLEFYLT